jgi:nucleotide-binding universal stress UspA family protein
MPYHHVLTVYDGTDQSEEVLDMVCRIVRPHHARLTILIVKLVPLSEELPTYQAGADPQVDALVQRAERFAASRKVTAATGVRYARAMGPIVVQEARFHGTDLVALAVPDMELLPSDRLSHVDLRAVLRQTTCAVMLCRPGREGT